MTGDRSTGNRRTGDRRPGDRRGARHRANADRDQRRAERRVELLEAAVGVIRKDGPGASMDGMARAGGVTKPILYRHFGDRDGLVDAVADRFINELTPRLEAALASDQDPRELLRTSIDVYLQFIEADPEVYRFLVFQSLGPTPAAGQRLAGLIPRIGDMVALVIGERARDLGGDSGIAEPWGHGIVGFVHQAGFWWIERRTLPRSRLVDYLTALLWDGMDSLLQSQPGKDPS